MKTGKKIIILTAVFLIAAAVYFMWPVGQKKEEGEQVIYTAMSEATLPVVYPKMGGMTMAPILGNRGENVVTESRDSLLVLPEDRKLEIVIEESSDLSVLSYEIRSLDLAHLVERTSVTDWTMENGTVTAVLPIQNLIEEGVEYQLGICVGLKDGSSAWYYSRIIDTDGTHALEMVALAAEFSAKTFHYESAQELTMYMETSPSADNSSFGVVTLKNSFNQMTWGTMGAERVSEPRIRLKELNGELANVELEYEVSRTDKETGIERYLVTENFTLKWATQRIYMMDYERRMKEVFTGDRNLFSGKRILLGISDGEDLYAVNSANGRFRTFVNNRELWSYDVSEGTTALVFSFCDTMEDGSLDVRAYEDRHGIEILSVDDDGNIDFLVYGYMNRGTHEGWRGVSYYHYDAGANTLKEKIFIPRTETYEELKSDVERLAFEGKNNVFYVYLDGSVYGIDMTSYEYVVVASGLREDTFAVSGDSSRLAWQEGAGIYDSKVLYLMDLNTGMKTQIGDGTGDSYRVLGFVGNDCVYGVGEDEDYMMANGRIMGLYLKSLEIVDTNMESAMHYEKNGYYIRDVKVDDSRIHITRVRDTSDGFFAEVSDDTLVCNVEILPDRMEKIGWYVSNVKGRVYFVQLDKDIPASQRIKMVSPKKVVVGNEVVLSLKTGRTDAEAPVEFYAYGHGRCLGVFYEFADAVKLAHDAMGFVSVGANEPIWVRGSRPGAYFMRDQQGEVEQFEEIRGLFTGESQKTEKGLFLEATGTDLNQILYFVSQNQPVMVNMGTGRYLFLTGYDQGHVRVWDPVVGQSETMTLDTAAERFEEAGNDFITCIYAE